MYVCGHVLLRVYTAVVGLSISVGAYERWCGVDDAMMTWLAVPEVMEALHVQADKKGTEKNNLNYQGGASTSNHRKGQRQSLCSNHAKPRAE